MDRLVKAIDDLLQATVPAGLIIETKTFPLSEVETVWAMLGGVPRPVFQIS